MTGSVDLSPLYPAVNTGILTLAGGAITFLASWAVWLMHKYAPPFVGAQLEAKAASDLNTALANGVAIGMTRLEAWESVHRDMAVQGAVTRFAVQYAIDHAPEAIAHFGLAPDELAFKALAFLPMPKTMSNMGDGTTGAVVTSAPVESTPLAPAG
jgi:hypothetical protein